ncbi:MAG: hypothetical protein QXL94_03695 [Candidatus Parvarchaeum sp.]
MDGKDSLIERIEEVKKKIAEFESNLNISSIDIDRITIDKNSKLINQIEDYKKRINSIENDVLNKKTEYPVEIEPLLSSKKIEAVNLSQPKIEKDNSQYQDIQKTINRVEMEKQEVENINNLLERLKKNAAEQRKINMQPDIKKAQNDLRDRIKTVDTMDEGMSKPSMNTIKSGIVNKSEDNNKPSDVNHNTVKITENDLHSISELISKLDELLRSNKEIADMLNELIREQKVDNAKTNKSSDLIKRLAMLSSNGKTD